MLRGLKEEYNRVMAHVTRLPLFPLNTVLFPGQLLPLHIFEPRYRLMISECLAGGLSFGVVLIRAGHAAGEEVTPYDVGTTARIEQVDRLNDGRMNILCVGEARFKLTALRHDRPFLNGDADLWPWEPLPTAQAASRATQIKNLLTTYIKRLAQATGNQVQLDEMPAEAAPLANLAAIVLQIPNREKQELLSASTIDHLLDACIRVLHRENRALKIAAALPLAPHDDTIPFSRN